MDINEWVMSLSDEMVDLLSDMNADMLTMMQGLNENQIRAVVALNGPVQINAVAGAGKTRVMVTRIAYMRSKGIKASEIMVTTFTKKAKEELLERLTKLVPQSYINLMTLGTTHSIGFHILKREYESLRHPLAGAFRKDILMENKRYMEDLKKEIIKDMSVPYEVKQELADIAPPQFNKAFGLAKNDNIGPMEYEAMHQGKNTRMDAYILFYHRYEEKKRKDCIVDGDDLLFLLVRLFQEHPEILEKYRRKYKYLACDEAQDNNGLQYTLFKMLAFPENNIMVVGDDDQSMYGFRGAKPEEFIDFGKTYKGTQAISLEMNYRSKPGILRAANMLIKNNRNRIIKELRTNKVSEDNSVMLSSYYDENEEAKAIVEEIVNMTEQRSIAHKQIAILYRTNAQSRAFEDQLIMAGLPYVIHGGISFYERAEVKDLVCYLRLVVDVDDNEAFERIYNKPKRYLGKAFLEKARKQSTSYWKSITNPHLYKGLKNYEKNGVDSIVRLVKGLRGTEAAGGTPEELIDIILSEGGYADYLVEEGDEEDEGNSRMENVNTLKYVMTKFSNIQDFLDYIYKMTTTAKHDINGVQLMTIHKSKGLEFEAGFLVGAVEGTLPHFKSIEAEAEGDDKAIQEERRLGYVAVTRAKDECHISTVRSFNGKPVKPSRFVKEMMPVLTLVNQNVKDEDESKEGPKTLLEYRQATGKEFNKMVRQSIEKEKAVLREILED